MQKLQDSLFSVLKSTYISPAVLGYLEISEDDNESILGGILNDSRYGWLSHGPRFCVIDLKTGQKVAARTFGAIINNFQSVVTCVTDIPTPLTENSLQLLIGLECDAAGGIICLFHVNGSQILRCIQINTVIVNLAVFDGIPDGPFNCFDGVIVAGARNGELFIIDLNKTSLMQALKDTLQGNEYLVRNESNPSDLTLIMHTDLPDIDEYRELALENDNHLAMLLNNDAYVDGHFLFRNPDGSIRMKAKHDHISISALQYVPQLGSLTVGFNFGAFQIWNLISLNLEFTSGVNVECLPVTHFGFQEPCDDPRAFCYLWVIYSVENRSEGVEFPLAVMYSLTYQGKRMLSDVKCLYQGFLTSDIRFQVELNCIEPAQLIAGRCVACHTYSIASILGDDGEDSVLNMCQIVWECWGESSKASIQYGMMLFDLDQWYKDQMPATYPLQSSTFMSITTCIDLINTESPLTDIRLLPFSMMPYSHATRLEEHFYPNSLQYSCVCLSASEICTINTTGVQRQIIFGMDDAGPTVLLNPGQLYKQCVAAGLIPLYVDTHLSISSADEQRKFLLSVALEARLSRFLKRCAHDWATGSHSGAGCTLALVVDWCWHRALALKQNAMELVAPLFYLSGLPDRNVCRCLEHCVRQLTQLTSLLDAVLTKCCNLVMPDALSEMEEKFKGIGIVTMYFQVVQWFLNVGLLPEHQESHSMDNERLQYPQQTLVKFYQKRRLKLHRLEDKETSDENVANRSCSLLYIDQLIENECGGEQVFEMWRKGGSECDGVYPPPSLYALLRIYLLPDIAEEHKHSLVLYLLVDYSMVYDEVRYEAVIRRLMQFPTMFGLSNTAIKATQAFWHLDHRDFDFALDQLQCLTGNTLSDWQHNVVLSALLAQKKTQAALQYLHVRKPAPIHNINRETNKNSDEFNLSKLNYMEKIEDWQSCCNLYLARGLVFEALNVVRTCCQNSRSTEERTSVLNFFYNSCRNSGQLSKILQVTLSQFEEEVFIKYLEECGDQQSMDIPVMYYLQQARYLEAQYYNNSLKEKRGKQRDLATSLESLLDPRSDRDGVRDTLIDVLCTSLPVITKKVAHCAYNQSVSKQYIVKPKPMSVFVESQSENSKFTYKSSFIQNAIENANETWMSKPNAKRGVKRALNIEETPFLCTPKLSRTLESIFRQDIEDVEMHSPSKRPKLDLKMTPKTPKTQSGLKLNDKLAKEMEALLEMPEIQSSLQWKDHNADMSPVHRSIREATPQSILKRRFISEINRDNLSPVDLRYLCESDDSMMETASVHTHNSDTTKLLRFTIPSHSDSTPSPPIVDIGPEVEKNINFETVIRIAGTTPTNKMTEDSPFESPPKKIATEEKVLSKRPYKDNVRARRTLSISANSSLSDDPNTSVESIADIPFTLINPRYSYENKYRKERSRSATPETKELKDDQSEARWEIDISGTNYENVISKTTEGSVIIMDKDDKSPVTSICAPKTPKSRPSINSGNDERYITPNRGRQVITPDRQDSPIVTPLLQRSNSGRQIVTPDRQDSPIVTPLLQHRITRSRSKTPEVERIISPKTSPMLDSIPELPTQESESDAHPEKTTLSIPRQIRSRSRSKTPERLIEIKKLSPLEMICESPTKQENTPESPITSHQSSDTVRYRSKTPEIIKDKAASPRILRNKNRSKTPERLTEIKNASTLNIICESPTKESRELPTPLPEGAKTSEAVNTTDPMSVIRPRSLRSRSKTPDRDSPKILPSIEKSKTKKPLSRIVLEANAFAKTKSLAETNSPLSMSSTEMSFQKSILEDSSDSIAQCTPLKKQEILPNFAFSPIDRTPILQSPCDSVLSDNSNNENQMDITIDSPIIPGPVNETFIDKSVLGSYKSSIAEDSNETDNSLKDIEKITPMTEKRSDISENQMDISIASPITPGPVNETYINKSVLGDYKSSFDDEDSNDLFIYSSLKDTEKIRNITENSRDISEMSNKSILQDASSLITSDSDNDEKNESNAKISPHVIQQEKQIIVEIEREINEIEGDISNHSHSDALSIQVDHSDSSREGVLNETSSNGSEEESLEEENDNESSSNEDDVISINDSSDNDRSQDLKIYEESCDEQTDERASADPFDELEHVRENTDSDHESVIVDKYSKNMQMDIDTVKDNSSNPMKVESNEEVKELAVISDPHNQEPIEKHIGTKSPIPNLINVSDGNLANYSLMTEDNSVVGTDDSNIDLNYSTEVPVEVLIANTEQSYDIQIELQMKTDTQEIDFNETQADAQDASEIEIEVQVDNQQKADSDLQVNTAVDKSEENKPVDGKSDDSEHVVDKMASEIIEKIKQEIKSTTPKFRKQTKSLEGTGNLDNKNVRRNSVSSSNKTDPKLFPLAHSLKTKSGSLDNLENKEEVEKSMETVVLRRISKSTSLNDSSVLDVCDKSSNETQKVSRKSRKSVVKPELSVIPEMSTVESSPKLDLETIISESSVSRRLTRHQKLTLESWLQVPETPPKTTMKRGAVKPAKSTEEENSNSKTGSPNSEGSPHDSYSVGSESMSSEEPPRRLTRAASENKVTPKSSRITRRMSVDMERLKRSPPGWSSGVDFVDSPTRPRRRSFTKAVEALVTPKGTRRISTDKKMENDSLESGDLTPSRRMTRSSSLQPTSSNTSDTKRRKKPASTDGRSRRK